MGNDFSSLAAIALMVFLSVFMFVRFGYPISGLVLGRQERRLDAVLNQQLLLDVHPRIALGASTGFVIFCFMVGFMVGGALIWGLAAAGIGFFAPFVVIRHLEQKRRAKLELQIVDGIMTLASAVRAGLNLVQAMELLVVNYSGPIKQEFAQLLREYQMGLDLNHAMRNTANRIGSKNYRLLFTAIEMHRLRGGDTAESLDRIAESVREIQRLEGKLDALTAQGRTQARMMAAAPIVILFLYYLIDPAGVTMLFVEPTGRLMLLGAGVLIVVGFLWIRKIMAVDI